LVVAKEIGGPTEHAWRWWKTLTHGSKQMTTEQKKKLLADVQAASFALGRILDGGHDINGALSEESSKIFRNSCLDALCGLVFLDAALTAAIGTDNL
jgi:hypothetical protein